MNIEKESVGDGELHNGHTVVGTVRTKLSSLGFTAVKGVLFRCPGSTEPTPNTNPVWVGGPGVTADSSATGGFPLLPGDACFMPIERLDLIYVVSSADGQDIAWLGL